MADRQDQRRDSPHPLDDVPPREELQQRTDNGEHRERPPAPHGSRKPLEAADEYGGPEPMGGPEAAGFDPEKGAGPHPEGSPAPIGVGTLDRDIAGATSDQGLSDIGAMGPEAENKPDGERE
jgi:hypothetical protein